jgi:hypothetical protein
VDHVGRSFTLHPLIQRVLREELGCEHDGTIAAMIEARCGCFGDNDDCIDGGKRRVMREVAAAAGHVLDRMKDDSLQRAAWICAMRARVLQMNWLVTESDSPACGIQYGHLQDDLNRLQGAAPDVRDVAACRDRPAEICHAQLATIAAGDSMSTLGMPVYNAGQCDRGLDVLHRALHCYSALGSVWGPCCMLPHSTSAAVSSSIRSIGRFIRHKGLLSGDFKRAIALYEHALRVFILHFAHIDADIAGTKAWQGIAYGEMTNTIKPLSCSRKLCEFTNKFSVQILAINGRRYGCNKTSMRSHRAAGSAARVEASIVLCILQIFLLLNGIVN